MNIFKLIFTLTVISIVTTSSFCQNIYPEIRYFTSKDYNAQTQNMASFQDSRGIMYFANASGILEFDGVNWRLIKIDKNAQAGAFYPLNSNKIYVGANNEFGYISPNISGDYKYHSLSGKVPVKDANFKLIRDIYLQNKTFICRSSDYFLFFSDDSCTNVIPKFTQEGFNSSYQINNTIYTVVPDSGIFALNNNTNLAYVKGSNQFNSNPIKGLFPDNDGYFTIITLNNGFYKFNGQTFVPISTPTDSYIKGNINKAFIISPNRYLLSLISGQLVVTNNNFDIISIIYAKNGAELTTPVYAQFDKNDNIWISMYTGVACINLNTPIMHYSENYDLNLKTNSTLLFNNYLYIANSKGLLYNKWDKQTNTLENTSFTYLPHPNNKDITLKIDTIHNRLIGGSLTGFFEIINNQYQYIIPKTRVRNFIKIPQIPNTVVIAANEDIVLATIDKNKWKIQRLTGFNQTSRQMEYDSEGQIWISDRNRNLFKINISENIANHTYSITDMVTFDKNNNKGLPDSVDYYLLKKDNKILVGTIKGVYFYDSKTLTFKPFDLINKYIGFDKQVTEMLTDNNGNIWLKVQDVTNNANTYNNKVSVALVMLKKTTEGYTKIEDPFYGFINIVNSFMQLSDSIILINNAAGFSTINLNKKLTKDTIFARFNNIKLLQSDSVLFKGLFTDESGQLLQYQNTGKTILVKYADNSLSFNFSAIYYNFYQNMEYTYKLEGFDKDWSSWSEYSFKEYTNLPEGTYTMHLKVKNYNTISEETTFTFKILPPWYRTWWAYTAYGILFVVIVALVAWLNSLRLIRQKEILEQKVIVRTAEIQKQKDEIHIQYQILNRQKEEILTQNEMLHQQKEEIQTQNEILQQSKEEILTQNEEIVLQNEEILKQKKDIVDSINYALKIQMAMLPSQELFSTYLPDHFIFFKPRDIVSGDFYWLKKIKNYTFLAIADCTGHGVPAAFMSMLGMSFLNEIISRASIDGTNLILNNLRKRIKTTLKQHDPNINQKDGMDMVLISIDNESLDMNYSGAYNSLYIVREGTEFEHAPNENTKIELIKSDEATLFEFKADRMPVAVHINEHDFTCVNFKLQKGDILYGGSDGFQDQVGGEKRKKYMTKNYKQLLLSMYNKTMPQQQQTLTDTLKLWQGYNEQIDDILIVGVKF